MAIPDAQVPMASDEDNVARQPARVSVVVPAYNQQPFLPVCLRSLFAQTYPVARFDIILVDDGSTDGTAAVARRASQEWTGKLHVVEKPNGGPASARNAGIGASEAEVVAFIDSDCVAEPGWLAEVVGALTDSSAAGVGGPIINSFSSGWVARYLDATGIYRHRVRNGQVDYLLTANVAFRRDALLAVGGFSEAGWAEDADLSFRLREAGHSLLLAKYGSVVHYGSPLSARGLARELYRYGRGNFIQSRNWHNGRTPFVEFTRHLGAVALSPYVALRLAPRVGLWRATSFWPLVVLEHSAFCSGLIGGMLGSANQGGKRRGTGFRQRHHARA